MGFLASLGKYCSKRGQRKQQFGLLGRLPFGVRPSLHVDMELADALGLHHVVVNVAHGDGVGGDGVGVGVRGLARI